MIKRVLFFLLMAMGCAAVDPVPVLVNLNGSPENFAGWPTNTLTEFVGQGDTVAATNTLDVNCLAFDGTQYVTIPYCSIGTAPTWYISMWVYYDGAATGSPEYLYSEGSGSSSDPILGITLSSGVVGVVDRISTVSAECASQACNTALAIGWHYVEVFKTDVVTYAIKYDGVVQSLAGQSSVGANTSGSPCTKSSFGCLSRTSNSSFFAGILGPADINGSGNYTFSEGEGLPQDTSGNGNHATACTATWITTDGIESANLAAGFTKEGTRYNTALNERVDGKIVPLPTKSQLTFDGVGDYVGMSLPTEITPNILTYTFNLIPFGGQTATFFWADSFPDFRVQGRITSSGEVQIFQRWPDLVTWTTTLNVDLNEENDITVIFDLASGSATVVVNGETDSNPSFLTSNLSTEHFKFGTYSAVSEWFNGIMRSVYAEADGAALFDYDFTTYAGKTTTVITDLSGNGNDGTVVPNGDIEDMWATRWSGRTVSEDSAVVSDGTGQYIDLGDVQAQTGIELEIDMEWFPDGSSELMGTFESGCHLQFGFLATSYNAYFGASGQILDIQGVTGRQTHKINDTGYYLDGNLVGTWSGSTEFTATGVEGIYLFARQLSGVSSIHAACSIYSAKISVSNTLVRDMIPLPDGTFLDRVENKVYSNDGTGTLVTTHVVSDGEGTVVDSKNYLPVANEGGAVHNNAECLVVIGGVTNSYTDLLEWTGGDDITGEIENVWYYDTTPSNTKALDVFADKFNGVWSLATSTTPEPAPVYAAVLPTYTLNEPTTNYPGTFAAFAPPVSNFTVSASAPEIAEYTRRVSSGDVLALTAENMDSNSSFIVYGASSSNATVLSVEGQVAAIEFGELAEVSLLWVSNSFGASYPVALGAAEAKWMMDEPVAGNAFTVFGNNLSGAWLFNATEDEWVESDDSNPFRAVFTSPSDWATGSHEIYLHNGNGKGYGWSDALTLTVKASSIFNPDHPWETDSNNWWDVTSYGADGSDSTTDTAAFISGLEAVANSSAYTNRTLYIPAGTYLFDTAWNLNKSGTPRIKGAGMGQTILKAGPNLPDNYAMMDIYCDNGIIFEDLTIELPGQRDYSDEAVIKAQTANNLLFQRVEITATNRASMNEQTIDFENSNKIVFRDCDFKIGQKYWFGNCDEILMTNNTFYGVHDNNNLLGFGGRKIAVMDSTFQNLDNSDTRDGDGWAKGRLIAGGVYGMCDFHAEGLESFDMAPRVPSFWITNNITATSTNIPTSKDDFEYYRTFTFDSLTRPDMEVGNQFVSFESDGTNTVRSYHANNYDSTAGTMDVYFDDWELDFIPSTWPQTAWIKDKVDQNSSEQILMEGGNTSYRGVVAFATSNTVTMTGYSTKNESTGVGWITIVDGRGLGQSRRITGNSSDTATIEGTWRVIPDTTSRVTVGKYANNFVVYNCDLDSVSQPDESTASAGVQFTGSGSAYVVSNRITDTETFLTLSGECQAYFNSENTVNPIYFCVIEGNVSSNNLNGIDTGFGLRPSGGDNYPGDVAILGNVMRGNHLSSIDDMVGFGLALRDETTTNSAMDHFSKTLFQDNTFEDFETLVYGDDIFGAVWSGNTTNGVPYIAP